MKSFITRTLPRPNYNDELNEGEIGRACSTNGREQKCSQDIGGEARRKQTTRKTKL
jgi:hypothetical protein